MLYPNTQPSGVVGGGQDNKKRLQQMLSRSGAAPLFGSSGRSASVASLPSVGAPSLSFNPFLKMLAGHPGETLDSLPNNDPLSGFNGSSVPTSSDPSAMGGAQAPSAGYTQAPNGGFVPSANPFDSGGNSASTGHFNGGLQPSDPSAPTQGQGGMNIDPSTPFYHTLMQLALYGLGN